MQSRSFQDASYERYRWGFNGKEDDEDGGFQDYGMRGYDQKSCVFWSVDPIAAKYPELSPYQFASRSPISGVDLDGLEYVLYLNSPYLSDEYKGVTNIKVQNQSDIYRQRELTYWALNHNYTTKSEIFLKSKGINEPIAELKYDKTAKQGITVIMSSWDSKQSKLVKESYTIPPNNGLDGRPADAYYPVDVMLVNKDYYSSWDFQGDYEDRGVGLVYGISEGNIKGHLKGYGYVELETSGRNALFLGALGASKGAVYGSYRGKNVGTPNNYSGDGGAVGVSTPIGELFFNWGFGEGVSDGKLWKGYQYSLVNVSAIFEY